VMAVAGMVLLGIVGLVALWPTLLVIPLTVFGLWMAMALLIKAYRLHREAYAWRDFGSPGQRD
jgi:hypothetical protein